MEANGRERLQPARSNQKGEHPQLGLAWWLDLPGEVSLEATPLAINGVLYFTGSYAAVYAVDGASGKLLWSHDPEIWKHNPAKMRLIFAVNRGVAYSDGRIFSAALDGRLFALDAKTGKLSGASRRQPRNPAIHHRRAAHLQRQGHHRQWRRGFRRPRLCDRL